jgi:hypothetical protein
MKRFLILIVAALLITAFSAQSSFAQYKLPEKGPTKKDVPRNNWGVGLDYSEGGFGPMIAYYLPSGSNSDFLFKLSVAGYSDSKEIQRTDLNGNVYIENKINRIFTMPMSIGWRVEPFKADLEGNFNPVFSIGLSPALIAYNPYDQEFFSAIDDTKTKFAFGGFTGVGFTYQQSEGVSMNMNFNYYYLPVLGEGIYSIENNEIKNVGGFQISFGINFLN